jgi:hypothetical protein
LGFRVYGLRFKGLGFKGLGFKGLRFKGLGFRVQGAADLRLAFNCRDRISEHGKDMKRLPHILCVCEREKTLMRSHTPCSLEAILHTGLGFSV